MQPARVGSRVGVIQVTTRHRIGRRLQEIRRLVRHPIAVDAGALALSQYAAAALGLLTALVAARLIGPAAYGSAVLVIAYPTLVWSLVTVKSVSVTTRYLAKFTATGKAEQARGICKLGYAIDFVAAITTLLVIIATSGWLARTVFGHVAGAWWLAVSYAASLPLYSLNGTSSAVLTSFHRFRWLAVCELLEKLAALALTLVLVGAGWEAAGVVLAAAVAQIVSGVTTAACASVALNRAGVGSWWSASLRPVAGYRGELASFFGWNYVVATLGGILTQVPLLLLGQTRGPGEAAFFRLASSIATAGAYIESALGRVVYPLLSARTATQPLSMMLATVKRWTVQSGLPAGLLLLMAVPALGLVLPRLLGEEYEAMVRGTQALVVGTAASAAFFWLTPLYYASGRIRSWATLYGIYTGVVLLAVVAVAPTWGFSGVAAVMGFGKVLMTVGLAARVVGVRRAV